MQNQWERTHCGIHLSFRGSRRRADPQRWCDDGGESARSQCATTPAKATDVPPEVQRCAIAPHRDPNSGAERSSTMASPCAVAAPDESLRQVLMVRVRVGVSWARSVFIVPDPQNRRRGSAAPEEGGGSPRCALGWLPRRPKG
jgi:hypothetical protein